MSKTSSDHDTHFSSIYQAWLDHPPQVADGQRTLYLTRLTTPIGTMFLAASDDGVCLLEFNDRRILAAELADLQKRLNAAIIVGDNQHTRLAKAELDAYFAGTLKQFRVPLHAPGTAFQEQVWHTLQAIPYGMTWSYAQEAQYMARPSAVRAVANANGQNRISILIPCHRVIGSNGSLTGYGGGLERKQWLLEHERRYGTVGQSH